MFDGGFSVDSSGKYPLQFYTNFITDKVKTLLNKIKQLKESNVKFQNTMIKEIESLGEYLRLKKSNKERRMRNDNKENRRGARHKENIDDN